MAATDVCILKIVGRYQEQNIVNTLHYQITTQASEDTEVLEHLIQAWYGANETAWLARHSDQYELIGYKAFKKTGSAKTPSYVPRGNSGAVVGDEQPAAICRTITLYTADAKFRRRGRIMLSGSVADMFNDTDGAVTSTEMSLLATLGGYFLGTISDSGDEFRCVIPAAGEDGVQPVIDTKGRATPSIVRSRRVRNFHIG